MPYLALTPAAIAPTLQPAESVFVNIESCRYIIIAVKGSTVNKNDLIKAVADSAELSNADATRALDGVFDAITSSLKKGVEVRLVGFGSFSVVKRKKTTGRNPRTGETIQIPASKQPKFKPGKALKEAVN